VTKRRSNPRTSNVRTYLKRTAHASADDCEAWNFKIIPKTAMITGLVPLSLDPDTVHGDFMQIKYHKGQANEQNYSREGSRITFKRWQAGQVAKHMDSPEVEDFAADKNANKEHARKYGCGTADAPKKDYEFKGYGE
jgi:hypothetical protein